MNKEEAMRLRGLVPLNTLPEQDLAALIEALEVREITAGGLLFRAGDTDTGHIYLLSGKIELLAEDVVVDVIVAGAAKARFPLAHRFPREYTARARSDIRYVVIEGHLLGQLLEKDRRSALSGAGSGEDARAADWIGKLLQSRVFQAVPKEDLKTLLRRMETVEARAGDVLIEEGGAGDYFYLLDRGEAEVVRGDSRLALLSGGDMFGEEALLGDSPRGATVRMRTDGVLLRLDRDSFRRLVRLPALRRCDAERASELLAEGWLLLDVRETGHFEAGHPPGAINLPLDSLRYQAASLSHERCYIVCAENLDQALVAVYLLTERGFDVLALEGEVEALKVDPDTQSLFEPGEMVSELPPLSDASRLEADFRLQIEDVNARLEAANRRCAELQAQRDALRESLEQARAESDSGQGRRGGLEQELKAQKAQSEALQTELTLLRRLESDARNDVTRVRAENARLQAELREHNATETVIPLPSVDDGRALRRNQLDLEHRLGVVERELSDAGKRLRELQRQRDREVATLSDRVLLLESQLADSGRAIIDASNRYKEAERAYQERIAELEALTAPDAAKQDQEKAALSKRIEELEAQLQSGEEERADLRRQLQAGNEEAEELRGLLENSVASIEALKAELQMVRDQAEMEYQSMSAEMNLVREKHGEGPSMSVRLETLRQELNTANKALREAEEALEEAHDERQFLEDSLEDRDRDLDQLGARVSELEERLREAESLLDDKESELDRVEAALQASQQECEEIRALDLRDPRLNAPEIGVADDSYRGGRGRIGLLLGILLTLAAMYGVWRAGLLPPPTQESGTKPRVAAAESGPAATTKAAPPRNAVRYLPERGGPVSRVAVRDRLSDGSRGPAMRQLSGSLFLMGSDAPWAPDNARPRHGVSVGPFWISEHEITNAEYRRFTRETRRRPPLQTGWKGDDLPVSGVSWEDASAYAAWLSRKTGHHYRLPSESEWEYAAAGGMTTRYWWGDMPEPRHENCADCGTSYDDRQPAPVGSFDANPFGLFDMAGNVMEWVSDCYRADYRVPLSRADCSQHVFRGGDFHRPLEQLYTVARGGGAPDLRSPYLGFRVVRGDG